MIVCPGVPLTCERDMVPALLDGRITDRLGFAAGGSRFGSDAESVNATRLASRLAEHRRRGRQHQLCVVALAELDPTIGAFLPGPAEDHHRVQILRNVVTQPQREACASDDDEQCHHRLHRDLHHQHPLRPSSCHRRRTMSEHHDVVVIRGDPIVRVKHPRGSFDDLFANGTGRGMLRGVHEVPSRVSATREPREQTVAGLADDRPPKVRRSAGLDEGEGTDDVGPVVR